MLRFSLTLPGIITSKRLLTFDPLDCAGKSGFDFPLCEGGEVVVDWGNILYPMVSRLWRKIRDKKRGKVESEDKTYKQPFRFHGGDSSDVIFRCEHEFIVKDPFALLAKHGAGMEKDILVIFDGDICFTGALTLSNLHEETCN